jgi:uncharacterized membrane protein
MTAYQWSPPYLAVAYIGIGLALLCALFLARQFARSPTAKRLPLLIVRGGVLALLLILLLNPVQVSQTRLPPHVPEMVYLVDCSRSMALDQPQNRLEQVKDAIEKSKHLPRKGAQPKVTLYSFGSELLAATDPRELHADEEATHLVAALEQLPSRFGEEMPAGIVLFSDGRLTDVAGLDGIVAGYRRLQLPIHVFPVGDPEASRDVAVQDVIAPREAMPGARVPIQVTLRSHGYQGQRADVRIRSLTDPVRKPLAILPITLTEGQQHHELIIDHDPNAGKLAVEVPPLDGEVTTANNSVPFQIGGRKRKIRVIYMEGTVVPYDEYHFVHDALVEDPNIECLSIVVDNQDAVQPRLHRVNDPGRGYPTTREELFSYDVIICSDIKRSAFTQQQLEWTAELVGKRGGGFAMVGGNTSFGAGYWDQTVWNELIPVDMSGGPSSMGRGTCWGVDFHVTIPREVERHPIWRIVDDPVRNRQILQQMPSFRGTNLVERLKPAATALGLSDQPLGGVGIMPVFSCEPFGKGRTFAMSTDTTRDWGLNFEFNWGEPGDNRYFRKFWRNVATWLAENSGGLNRRLKLDTDRVVYHPGQPIKITAHAYDERLEETNRYRLVARLRQTANTPARVDPSSLKPLQETALTPKLADKSYAGELAVPPLRIFPAPANDAASPLRVASLEVVAYDEDRQIAQSSLDVQVLDDPVEFQDPRPDREQLEHLAKAADGNVIQSAEELAQLLGSFSPGAGELIVNRVPLWDNAALWLVLLGLLTVDWLLRRWWGLA